MEAQERERIRAAKSLHIRQGVVPGTWVVVMKPENPSKLARHMWTQMIEEFKRTNVLILEVPFTVAVISTEAVFKALFKDEAESPNEAVLRELLARPPNIFGGTASPKTQG